MDLITLKPELIIEVRWNSGTRAAGGHTFICLLDLKESLGCGDFRALFALLIWVKKNRQ
jgi:hypothetical protein